MKKTTPASVIALGGILAALAVTVMTMGTLIPVATYVCPVICMILLQVVWKSCGRRIAWAWYGAVSILSMLFAPDKEAALIYVFLGYYPIIKNWLDRHSWKWALKSVYFNVSVLAAYWIMLNVLGLEQVIRDLSDSGLILTLVLLIVGNITFFLLDRLLSMTFPRRKWR